MPSQVRAFLERSGAPAGPPVDLFPVPSFGTYESFRGGRCGVHLMSERAVAWLLIVLTAGNVLMSLAYRRQHRVWRSFDPRAVPARVSGWNLRRRRVGVLCGVAGSTHQEPTYPASAAQLGQESDA